MSVSMTDRLVWGVVLHFVADWLLQNEWMAQNKQSLRHPAAWVHGAIHLLFLGLIFPWALALLAALLHIAIDTRLPLLWWMRHVKQMPPDKPNPIIEVWLDQVFHILVIALLALIPM